MRIVSFLSAGLLSLSLFAGALPLVVIAQDDPSQVEQNEGRQRGKGRGEWLQRIGLMRAPGEHEKAHEKVTGAFREIVARPSQATVRVLVDDAQVALGAVVDPAGYILTKASELKGKPQVQLADNRRFHAKIVGVDPLNDLAMLKIGAEALTVIDWADEAPLVGSWLATPALDPANAAVGVVSVSPRRIGSPSAMLGVQLEEDAKGPRVNQVLPGTGAERAGLQVNDIITHVNGNSIANRESLVEIIRKHRSGDTVLLSIKRGETDLALPATLSVITPGDPDKRRDFQNKLGGSLSARRDGFPLALQHDTVLRPADCGGPLVDLDGKAVGLNIARGGRVNSYAIPTSAIKPLLADLMSGNLAPDVVAKKKLAELLANLSRLKTTESDLATKAVEAEAALKKAAAAETEAKKVSDTDATALEKLHSLTFAAENSLKQLRVDLLKARAELKRSDAEKLVLEQSLPKE